MASSISNSSIWKQRRCGSQIGTWVVHIGKRTMPSHSAPLLTHHISLLTNGILQYFVSMVRKIIVFWLHKVCQLSTLQFFAAFLQSFFSTLMKTTGY